MRLIDADELLAQMIGMNDGWFDPRPAYDYESLIKIQPTIDAVPVKHGKWEYVPTDGKFRAILICSKCKRSVGEYDRYKFCPHCGAKMDLEEDQ